MPSTQNLLNAWAYVVSIQMLITWFHEFTILKFRIYTKFYPIKTRFPFVGVLAKTNETLRFDTMYMKIRNSGFEIRKTIW